jgi:hypothetical protein
MNLSYAGEPHYNIPEKNFQPNSNRIINEKNSIEPKVKRVLSNDDNLFMNYNRSTDDIDTEEVEAMTTEKDDNNYRSDESHSKSDSDNFKTDSDNYDSNENEHRYQRFSLHFLN